MKVDSEGETVRLLEKKRMIVLVLGDGVKIGGVREEEEEEWREDKRRKVEEWTQTLILSLFLFFLIN